MADPGQFRGANPYGVAYPLQDIHNYIGGGAIPPSPVEQYAESPTKQMHYLDMLVQLLSMDERNKMYDEWRKKVKSKDISWPKFEEDIEGARGRAGSPSYLNQQRIFGKTVY